MKELLNKIDEKLSELFNYWLWEDSELDFTHQLADLLRNTKERYVEYSFDEEEIKEFFEEFYNSISNLGRLDKNFESIFEFQIGNKEIIIYYEDFYTETYLKQTLEDLYSYNSLEEHFKALFGDSARVYYDNFYIDNIIDLNFRSMGSIDDEKVFGVEQSQIFNIENYYVIVR